MSVDAPPPYVGDEVRAPRRSWRTGIGAISVLVMLVVIGVVASLLAVRSGGGGSDSPEEAVRRLLVAAEASDALGVLDALVDDERDVLTEPLVELRDELVRLGVLGERFDLGAIGGVGVAAGAVALREEPLADDIVAVHLDGSVSMRIDPALLPLGASAAKELGAGDAEASTLELGGSVVVAVRDGDGWGVSLAYTLAERARRDAGQPAPVFGAGVPAAGAGSPEAAAEAVLGALMGGDVRRAIELVDPVEGRVLHEYGELLLAGDDTDPAAVQLSDVRTNVSGDGARRRIEVIGYRAIITHGDGGGSTTVERADGCTRITVAIDGDEELFDSCDADFSSGTGSVEVVEAVERDGRWFVAPARSLSRSLLDQVGRMVPDDLEEMGVWMLLAPVSSFLPGGGWAAYATGDDPAEECFGDMAADDDEWEAALAEQEACVRRLVEAGELDEEMLEPYLVGACYPAEPVLIEDAAAAHAEERACVQALVDSGQVSASQLDVIDLLGCSIAYDQLVGTGAPDERYDEALVAEATCLAQLDAAGNTEARFGLDQLEARRCRFVDRVAVDAAAEERTAALERSLACLRPKVETGEVEEYELEDLLPNRAGSSRTPSRAWLPRSRRVSSARTGAPSQPTEPPRPRSSSTVRTRPSPRERAQLTINLGRPRRLRSDNTVGQHGRRRQRRRGDGQADLRVQRVPRRLYRGRKRRLRLGHTERRRVRVHHRPPAVHRHAPLRAAHVRHHGRLGDRCSSGCAVGPDERVRERLAGGGQDRLLHDPGRGVNCQHAARTPFRSGRGARPQGRSQQRSPGGRSEPRGTGDQGGAGR